ncbi:DUF6230 family protein [Streptomyces chryseus]
MAPASVAAGGVLTAMATGALAASVAASGEAFKVSGDRLTGSGFTALPGLNVDSKTGAKHPVVVVTAQEAEVSNLCVSVLVKTPVGPVTVHMNAGDDEPVTATGLVVDSDQLQGDIKFTDVLGRAEGGSSGGFLARTARVTVHQPRFTGWQGTAGSFRLKGLSMRIKPGAHECF